MSCVTASELFKDASEFPTSVQEKGQCKHIVLLSLWTRQTSPTQFWPEPKPRRTISPRLPYWSTAEITQEAPHCVAHENKYARRDRNFFLQFVHLTFCRHSGEHYQLICLALIPVPLLKVILTLHAPSTHSTAQLCWNDTPPSRPTLNITSSRLSSLIF